MIVECGECGTRFRLDESKIGARGSRVRCSKCQHSFIVNPPGQKQRPLGESEVSSQPQPRPSRPFSGQNTMLDPGLALDVHETRAKNAGQGASPPPAPPAGVDVASRQPQAMPSPPSQEGEPRQQDVPTAVYQVPAEIKAAARAQNAARPALPESPAFPEQEHTETLELDIGSGGFGDEPTRIAPAPADVAAAVQLSPFGDSQQPKAAQPQAAALPSEVTVPDSGGPAMPEDVGFDAGNVPTRVAQLHEDALMQSSGAEPDPFDADDDAGSLPTRVATLQMAQQAAGMGVAAGFDEETRVLDQRQALSSSGALPADSSQGQDLPPLPDPSTTAPKVDEDAPLLVDDDDFVVVEEFGEADEMSPAQVDAPSSLPFVDPFAGDGGTPSFEGGLSSDGTFVSPAKGTSNELEAPQTDVPQAFELDKTTLAGVSPDLRAQARPPSVGPGPVKSAPRLWVTITMWSIGLLALAAGVLLYMSGGQLDARTWDRLQSSWRRGKSAAPVAVQGVVPLTMRSALYPTASGNQILVFFGEAENQSGKPAGPLDVVAKLRDEQGRLVGTARAPLGVTLNPAQLARLTDQDSLEDAFRQSLGGNEQPLVPSRERAAYTVVLLNPVAQLAKLRHSVSLEPSTLLEARPPKLAKPAEPPEERVEEKPAPKKRKRARGKRGRARRRPAAE